MGALRPKQEREAAKNVARQVIQDGGSYTEAARQSGCSVSTVHGWSKAENWRDEERNPTDANLEAAKRRAEQMRARSIASWEAVRQQEADAAGATIAKLRGAIEVAVDDKDDKMLRAAAIAYGILTDKAQLLSGHATIRQETSVDASNQITVASSVSAVLEDMAAVRMQLVEKQSA